MVSTTVPPNSALLRREGAFDGPLALAAILWIVDNSIFHAGDAYVEPPEGRTCRVSVASLDASCRHHVWCLFAEELWGNPVGPGHRHAHELDVGMVGASRCAAERRL